MHACFEMGSCQVTLRHVQELRAQLAVREREQRAMRQQRNALLAGLRRSTPRDVKQGDQRADVQDGLPGFLQGTPKGPPPHGRGGRQQRTCGEASTDSSRGSSREGSPAGGRLRPARVAGTAALSGDQAPPRREMYAASNTGADQERYTGEFAPDASCSIRVGPPAAAKALDGGAPEAQADAWAAPGSPAATPPNAEAAPDNKLWAHTMDAACSAPDSPPRSAMLSSLSDCPGSWARTPAALPADPEPGLDPHPRSSAQAGTPFVLPIHPGAGIWARTPEPAARGKPLGSPGSRSASAPPPDGGHAEPWGCRAGPAQRSRLARAAQRAAVEVGGNAFNIAMADAGDTGLQLAAESVLGHGDDVEWGDGQDGEAWGLQEGFGEPLHDPPLLARLANLKLVTDELLLEALL